MYVALYLYTGLDLSEHIGLPKKSTKSLVTLFLSVHGEHERKGIGTQLALETETIGRKNEIPVAEVK